MVVDSFDILRSTSHDLLDKTLQEDLIQKLKNSCYQAVIMSPPCATWSRAPWANEFGPKPLRSSVHPLGFPWLEGHKLDKVSKSNAMVEFCLQVISLAIQLGLAFLLEHPEDLGATTRWGGDTRPASIWQLLPMVSWVHAGDALTGAFYQCQLGATSPKPTRLLHNLPGLQRYLAAGLPLLDGANLYQGPLPKNCNCGRRHTRLIRQATDNTFATTAAAAYPPAMDHWLASTLFDHFLKGGSHKTAKENEENEGENSPQLDHKDSEGHPPHRRPDPEDLEGQPPRHPGGGQRDGALGQGEGPADAEGDDSGVVDGQGGASEEVEPPSKRLRQQPNLPRPSGRGPWAPHQVWYKGKARRMVDGLGLNSPGVRPVGHRLPSRSSAASRLASSFWEEVDTYVTELGKKGRLKLIAELALGRHDKSPFGDVVDGVRVRLDKVVRDLGQEPLPKKGDIPAEIAFRRVLAWGKIVEDADHRFDHWRAAWSSRGNSLGGGGI